MRTIFAVSAAVLALGAAGLAAAQATLATATASNGDTAPSTSVLRPGQDPNERVCRTITYTGSRLGGERVCKTRREWVELTERSRERTDEVVQGALRNTCLAGPNGAIC